MTLKLYHDSSATEEITDSNPDMMKKAGAPGEDVEEVTSIYLYNDDDTLTYENIQIEQVSVAEDWASGEDYVARDSDAEVEADVVEGSDGEHYICIQDHTSSSDDEPGEGTDWEDYWQLADEVVVDYSDDDGSNYSEPISLSDGDYNTETEILRRATITDLSEAFRRADIRHELTADEYVK